MKLKDYVKERSFSGKSLPVGETIFDLNGTEIEEVEVEYDGSRKTRYQLTTEDDEFLVGVKVMKGLKQAIEDGFAFARVTRNGTKKDDTTYTVVGLASAPSSVEVERNAVV